MWPSPTNTRIVNLEMIQEIFHGHQIVLPLFDIDLSAETSLPLPTGGLRNGIVARRTSGIENHHEKH